MFMLISSCIGRQVRLIDLLPIEVQIDAMFKLVVALVANKSQNRYMIKFTLCLCALSSVSFKLFIYLCL